MGREEKEEEKEVDDPFPPASRGSLVSPHLDNTALFEEICQILQGHIVIESLHIDCSAVRVLLRVHGGA